MPLNHLCSATVRLPVRERCETVPINQVRSNFTAVGVEEARTFATELSNVFRDLSRVLSHIPDKPSKERFLKELCTLVS